MKLLSKYRSLLLVLLGSLLFFTTYILIFSKFDESSVHSMELEIRKKIEHLDFFLEQRKEELKHRTDFASWDDHVPRKSPFFHVYRNDSLIYWNTNTVPVRQFADMHFPADGIIQLQNGWYFVRTVKLDSYILCASFLIKQEFPYENKDLRNQFESSFHLPFKAMISKEKGNGFSVNGEDGEFLFEVIPDENQVHSMEQQGFLLLALLFLITSALWSIYNWLSGLNSTFNIMGLAAILTLRYISYQLNWYGEMSTMEAFMPDLYASSELLPNFAEYMINCIVVFFTGAILMRLIRQVERSNLRRILSIVLLLSVFPLWHVILVVSQGLIENSSIPLVINRLFSLNFYSVLTIISMGSLLYAYYRYTDQMIEQIKRSGFSVVFVAVGIFITSIVYMLIEIAVGNELFFSSLLPLLLLSVLAYRHFSDRMRFSIGLDILLLLLFSAVTAINLSELNQRKEKSERVLFANQLATDKDLSTELEYSSLGPKLENDPFLLKFITSPRPIGVSDFEDLMERRFFNGFWERYEMNFSLFDENQHSLILDESQNIRFEDLERMIASHGTVSEMSPDIFYISDNTEQYSYIIRQKLENKDGKKAVLFCGLRSKKIPEEIGFPRLLISSQANVLESLENYSIARYHKGKLTTKYGSYNYPTAASVVRSWRNGNGFAVLGGFDHYILQSGGTDLVVLSTKEFSAIELITSFSYLFCFFGLLLLPVLVRTTNNSHLFRKTLSLAARIQLILIGLVFVALLGFGWGSGIFVRDQYNEYSSGVIREKMNSVDTELKSKLGVKKNLDINIDGNYMEYLLKKFSRVFVTDINIYDRSGILLASSRPKVFNTGLISEQMNPDAYYAVSVDKKSEFIHQENIGDLGYSSAYQPFYNADGHLLGYINLQHFGQQKDFEDQIQKFLVSIVNVFMLLLAVSVIMAIFISNWVTAPLRLLQESFAGVRFGEHNQKIDYRKNDEIGALVQDYNKKLEELEFAAERLAQSERESAWREMAKQVAHEIKNPLTPMKLSIQQLLRVYDPNNPSSAEKLEKVANSLIEQIDALTSIANEFSNFAKLPKPNEERMDLLPIIKGVIEMFRNEQDCEIELKTELKEVSVLADRDQMLRVFNNLIKNAAQAIPADRKGEISIQIALQKGKYVIRVNDNGVGISPEEQSKIFVPYFTTKSTGTGLGLAMVRQIVEGHRGTIDFETEEHIGTSFILTLPKV
jgi:two-component system, NtrC family, nitrogen regulation sensor histidine kinase NtrY